MTVFHCRPWHCWSAGQRWQLWCLSKVLCASIELESSGGECMGLLADQPGMLGQFGTYASGGWGRLAAASDGAANRVVVWCVVSCGNLSLVCQLLLALKIWEQLLGKCRYGVCNGSVKGMFCVVCKLFCSARCIVALGELISVLIVKVQVDLAAQGFAPNNSTTM